MSDFDKVLEKLLTEPGFARALAADPGRALAGYQLTAEEVSLLRTQVSEDAGADHAVETRTSQSSLAGLFGPVTAPANVADFGSASPAEQGFGAAPGLETERGLGTAPGAEGLPGHAAGRGAYPGVYPGGGGESEMVRGLGTAPDGGDSFRGLGAAPDDVSRGLGTAPPLGGSLGEAPAVPEGYQTRVDADGDGQWDAHTLHGAPGGGVEIHVDLNGDGQADFVGHDRDADGLVDWSQYDRDGDGRWDVRMYDTNGDGWMDRVEDADADPKG